MITISNFEKYVLPQILVRGEDYYESGAVLEIEEESTGEWIATVCGTENYEVTVAAEDNDLCCRKCFFHQPAQLQPIHKRHFNIRYQNIRLCFHDQRVCIFPVPCFSDKFKTIGIPVYMIPNPTPDDCLIFYQKFNLYLFILTHSV